MIGTRCRHGKSQSLIWPNATDQAIESMMPGGMKMGAASREAQRFHPRTVRRNTALAIVTGTIARSSHCGLSQQLQYHLSQEKIPVTNPVLGSGTTIGIVIHSVARSA